MTTAPADVQKLVDKHFNLLIASSLHSGSSKKAPGGICGIYYDGQCYYFEKGTIDKEGTSPTENTVFGIGSVTKTFTTSILGQQSSLFSTQVANSLPSGFSLTSAEQPVTYCQLATFTGGVVPSTPPGEPKAKQPDFQDFINALEPPGLPTGNVYSDASIGLLAQAMMYRDGYKTFDAANTQEWFQKYLLTPLAMRNTGTTAPSGSSGSGAFKFTNGSYHTTNYAGWVPWGAAGRAYSTCADMLTFVQANAGVSSLNGTTVPKYVLDGMQQAQKPRTGSQTGNNDIQQAFAWVVFNPTSANWYVGKDGGLRGVSAFVTCCPKKQLGVVILTNMHKVPVEGAAEAITTGLITL